NGKSFAQALAKGKTVWPMPSKPPRIRPAGQASRQHSALTSEAPRRKPIATSTSKSTGAARKASASRLYAATSTPASALRLHRHRGGQAPPPGGRGEPQDAAQRRSGSSTSQHRDRLQAGPRHVDPARGGAR